MKTKIIESGWRDEFTEAVDCARKEGWEPQWETFSVSHFAEGRSYLVVIEKQDIQ